MITGDNKQPMITLTCDQCGAEFQRRGITHRQQMKRGVTKHYCTRKCWSVAHAAVPIALTCEHCGVSFNRAPARQNSAVNAGRKKTFCSSTCWGRSEAARKNGESSKHHLLHQFGQRSKLEKWIETQLQQRFQELTIKACDRTTLDGLEIDLYIPELSLAIEFNGIFHYQPVHGAERLEKAQQNDKRKVTLCIEKQIDLWVIDTSAYKNFKPKTAHKYLNVCEQAIITAKTKKGLTT